MMKETLIAVVLMLAFTGKGSDASDCCGSYTDIYGKYHESELCADYCCINLGIAYKECCSDSSRQIPATKNENEDCVNNWIHEHVWVPIVGGIVGLIILIGICTCCCCCCGCCRRNPAPVIVHTAASPSATVAMSTNTMVSNNQYHTGYNQ